MNSNKILFFLLLSCLSLTCLAQDDKAILKEIKSLLSQSGKSFMELENEKSIQLANQALDLAVANNQNLFAAKAYNLIGLNFAEFSDLQKSISYYKKGLTYANKTNNDTIKGWLNNNLANVYCYHEVNYEEGIKHYKLGIQYSQKFNDISEITFSKMNLVSALFKVGNYAEGIGYLNEVKNYVDSEGDIEAKITMNLLYANYYDAQKNDVKAEEFYLKTIAFCDANNEDGYLNTHILNAYRFISVFYHARGEFDKAYEYLSKQDILKDKIYNEERSQSIATLGSEIEKQEANRQFQKIKAEREIQEQKLQNSRIIVILFVVIFTVLFLLLITFYKNNKERKQTNLELKVANEDLKIAKEKAEEASNLKSQFISTISHELRTPLYGVIGTTEILEEEYKVLRESSHLKALKFSANYLLALVNDILKVYKIEENKVVLENVVFNLEDKLVTIKDSLETIARKNNNQIEVKVDQQLPEFLYGDAIRLSQIIMNLLSNSLKFTKNGKVSVTANLRKKENNFYYITFQVIDNGIGIPKQYQEKVFEKFVQIERREEDYQGTGLGLTIVHKLVSLFNGTIQLESEEHVGTTFTVELPFQSGVDKTKDFITEYDVDLSDETEYRILVVEDNKINQVVTKKLLENHHFQCELVDDGYQAIELLQTETFDAILMDINMPKINGFETSKIIREKGFTLPIIAVTAFEKEEIMDKIKEAQINDVVVKPFEPAKLFYIIRSYINK